MYKTCCDELERLNPYAETYLARFLASREKEDVASENIKKAKEINSIMDREIARKTLISIGRALQKKRGGTVSAVEICHSGIYNIYEGKERL